MLIDTHAHLSDSKFDLDRDLVIKRALENGVTDIIEIACEQNLWKPSFEISRLNPRIFCSYGLHPHEAKNFTEETLAMLSKLLEDKKAVAVGETGLDYYYDHSPREVQKSVFRIHIDLARKFSKPLVIHCRLAYEDLIGILKEKADDKPYRGVIHCFSGNMYEAGTLTSLGFMLGIDGPVTYPNAKVLREVASLIPLEQLILETDCPYLAPKQHRSKRNEPSYIKDTAQELALLRHITFEEVCKITSQNAKTLFNI